MIISARETVAANPADQSAYNNYYTTQATELATQYGEIAEWWLDGGAVPS
jgi:hypothetical protein